MTPLLDNKGRFLLFGSPVLQIKADPCQTMKFTGKGILNGVAFVVGIVGLILSIYFYTAQKQFKAISFVVDPKHTLVLSPQHLPTSKLTILDQNGKQITRNLYSAGLYLWNSGTETILGADIIVPLVVAMPKGARLLELQSPNISRPDITQTSATIHTEPDGEESIQFRFRVLEPSEGIRTTVLYEGQGDEELSLKGGVLGIRDFTDTQQIAYQGRWTALWKGNAGLVVPLAFVLLVCLIFHGLGYVWSVVSKRWFSQRGETLAAWVVLAVFALMFLVGLGHWISFIVEPWLHPEKVVRQNIKDYIPSELTKN